MKLTGNALIAFEKWFMVKCESEGEYRHFIITSLQLKFDNLTNSMKYGVYVDWFDSILFFITNDCISDYCITIENRDYLYEDENYREINIDERTRPEARTKAIEKGNEIYNNKTSGHGT